MEFDKPKCAGTLFACRRFMGTRADDGVPGNSPSQPPAAVTHTSPLPVQQYTTMPTAMLGCVRALVAACAKMLATDCANI